MLLRQTLLYLPAQLLAPLAQFVAAVVWTHWMSPEQYGVLTFIVAAQDLVFVVCLSWWSGFCLRYLAGFTRDEAADCRRSESAILILTALTCAAVTVALLAYLDALARYYLVMVTMVFLGSRAIDVHFAERARAQERILDYTVAQTAGPVVGFGLATLGVFFLQATPAVALAGFAVAQAAAALWLVRRLGIELTLTRPDGRMLRRALAYGSPVIIAGILGWFIMNGVRFVVQEMGGEVAVGLLAVGWSLGQRLTAVTAMLVTAAAYPLAVRRMATHSRADAMQHFAIGGTLLFGVVAPSSLGLWQIAPLLVDMTVAPAFREVTLAVLPAAIMAGAVRNLRVHYADQCFFLFERTRAGIVVNVVEAIALIGFCVIGYKLRGIPGAVEGCLAAAMVAAVFAFTMTRVMFGLPMPWRDWGRIALASAFMCALVNLSRHTPIAPGLQLTVEIAVGIVAYSLTLAMLFHDELLALWRARQARQAAPLLPHIAS